MGTGYDARTAMKKAMAIKVRKARQPEYAKYLGSKVWKEKKSEVRERSGGICECEGGCSNKAYEVHHKTYPKVLGTESIDTLQDLCQQCHPARHEKIGYSEFNPCCRRAYV